MFEPEGQLTSWFAISLIMLTSSLLLFQMTNTNVLKIHPYIAAALVSIFILLDICITITALIPYNQRSNEIHNKLGLGAGLGYNIKNERLYTKIYTVIISIFILIQLMICIYVIRDSFTRAGKMRKGTRKGKFSIYGLF